MIDDTIDSIKKIVFEVTELTELHPNDSFRDKGINSIDMLSILQKTEKHFELTIPDDELIMSNFESLKKLNNLIIRLIKQKEG